MSRFDPDAGNAAALRRAMERALWDSVSQVLASQGLDDAGGLPRSARASPLDFGAYFDLVLPPPDGQPVALGQGLDMRSFHLGVHRPVACSASRTNTGWPPFPLTLRIASNR